MKAMYDAVTLDASLRKVPTSESITEIPRNFSYNYFWKIVPRVLYMWSVYLVFDSFASKRDSLSHMNTINRVRYMTKDGDYAWPGTVPVDGETLAAGRLRRRLKEEAFRLCAKVRCLRTAVHNVPLNIPRARALR